MKRGSFAGAERHTGAGREGLPGRTIVTWQHCSPDVDGDVNITGTCVQELSDAQVQELKDSLADALQKGEKLYLTQKVDRALIGGFIVDIGANRAHSSWL